MDSFYLNFDTFKESLFIIPDERLSVNWGEHENKMPSAIRVLKCLKQEMFVYFRFGTHQ